MTYDTDKVDALLAKVAELKRFQDFPGKIAQGVFDAAQALKPQTEMEYVLPEEPNVEQHDILRLIWEQGRGKHHQTLDYWWTRLREETARPKADKVPVIPAGADWSYEDRLNIWESVKKFPGTEAIAYVIDHIKSKRGV